MAELEGSLTTCSLGLGTNSGVSSPLGIKGEVGLLTGAAGAAVNVDSGVLPTGVLKEVGVTGEVGVKLGRLT